MPVRTREQFKLYCLKKLGHPVIEINVAEDQLQDRIDEALQFWQDYHYDGTEKHYFKHKMTQEDITRQWIYCPDDISFVTGVMPFDDSNASINMFDLRYQLRLHDLYDFTSVSYVPYEITMQHIRTLNLLFSGTPQFRFNRHKNRLMLDINWTSDVSPGEYVVIECYRKLVPDDKLLNGTISCNTSSKIIVGNNTTFDQDLSPGDFVLLSDGQEVQVGEINSSTEIVAVTTPTANVTGGTITKEGVSDVWDDRYMKRYGTEKFRLQWGDNIGAKFSGIQLPGGITLNGQEMIQRAEANIKELEQEMLDMHSGVLEWFIG